MTEPCWLSPVEWHNWSWRLNPYPRTPIRRAPSLKKDLTSRQRPIYSYHPGDIPSTRRTVMCCAEDNNRTYAAARRSDLKVRSESGNSTPIYQKRAGITDGLLLLRYQLLRVSVPYASYALQRTTGTPHNSTVFSRYESRGHFTLSVIN